MKAPICPLCLIRERSHDDEPGRSPEYYGSEANYFSTCFECCMLSGYRDHSHAYYGSPAQVAAGTFRAGYSWRTRESVQPLWESGSHVGYRCRKFAECGWEQRFTPEEREGCELHTLFPALPVLKGVCRDYQEHRQERGECDGRGHLTDHGEAQEHLRSDAAVWDPGKYIER